MAENQEKALIHLDPQDGNQIVIGENTGTINIHNNSKQNDAIKTLAEELRYSFANMEKYFHENKFSMQKKRGRKLK